MTLVSYSGRTVDLLIFQGVTPTEEAPISMGLGDTGRIVTGVQKVAQSFVSLFLTDRGSVAYEPDAGANFVRKLREGRISNTAAVTAEFSAAAALVKNYLNTNNPSTEPDEEILSVNLVDFEIKTGTIVLYINIVTVAGDKREIFLPIDTVIK